MVDACTIVSQEDEGVMGTLLRQALTLNSLRREHRITFHSCQIQLLVDSFTRSVLDEESSGLRGMRISFSSSFRTTFSMIPSCSSTFNSGLCTSRRAPVEAGAGLSGRMMRRGRQGLVIQQRQQVGGGIGIGLCRLGVNSCSLGRNCGYGGRGCRHGRLRVSRNVIAFDAEMDARPSQGRGFTTDSESDNESSKFNDIVPCIDLDEAEEDQVVLNNRPPGKRKLEAAEEDNNMAEANNLEHLLASVLAQGQRQSESWWQIPDSIYELLPLPKNFDIQLEILYDKLGCRINNRELLLRILVHKSYYMSKMPPHLKEKKLIKPSTSLELSERRQRAEVTDVDILMTFADAHGEARSQLSLVGDTILSLAASLHLIRQHPFLSTGIITERRSQLVCNSNLAHVWSSLLGLRELVLCDPPLSQSKKPAATIFLELQTKAFADTLEAYIGGLFVENGLVSALHCVETRLLPLLLLADPTRNPVASLQEQCVVLLQVQPEYKLVGIDNKNTANEACRIRVYIRGIRMATGVGKSQKLAKRDAAEKALIKWREVFGSL